nr:hypothetical protein [Mucilaginibacter pankratovii]
MAKLFIVGIPRDMDEIELVELASAYGIVNTLTVVTDRATGERAMALLPWRIMRELKGRSLRLTRPRSTGVPLLLGSQKTWQEELARQTILHQSRLNTWQ